LPPCQKSLCNWCCVICQPVSRHSLSATSIGSMLCASHHFFSSPPRCRSRWWTRHRGTVNSSLTLRPRAREPPNWKTRFTKERSLPARSPGALRGKPVRGRFHQASQGERQPYQDSSDGSGIFELQPIRRPARPGRKSARVLTKHGSNFAIAVSQWADEP
jgi:hypothetical protein